MKWIYNLADGPSKLGRWHVSLSEFEFNVVLRPAMKIQAADTFKRVGTDVTDLEEDLAEMMVSLIER